MVSPELPQKVLDLVVVKAEAGYVLVHAFRLKSTIRSNQAPSYDSGLAKRIRLITARIIEKGGAEA